MPYPAHLIHDDETVALDLNPHWWFFIQHIAVGTGILGLILMIMTTMLTNTNHIATRGTLGYFDQKAMTSFIRNKPETY